MKKFFEILGLISLMCFSFFYTEQTVSVVKEYDDIMIELKEKADSYKQKSKDAIIVDQTIIPGIHGKEVDIDKSYSKMKRYGKFNESLIVMKNTKPNISIEDNYDKFIIGGNGEKNKVSLIFLATKDIDISKVLNILNAKQVKANFFVDFYFYNQEIIQILVSNGYDIGNLSLNYDYNDSSFMWLTAKIKKAANTTYCYDDSFDQNTLLLCSNEKIYTIKPSIITETRPLLEIKKEIKNGSIISFHINDILNKELGAIINYLKSKNFEIVTLTELLKE